MLTWGVYEDYEEVARLRPNRCKGFRSEHEARQSLEDVCGQRSDRAACRAVEGTWKKKEKSVGRSARKG